MPYSPPAGNSVSFDFTTAYTPPAGNSVSFDFVDAAGGITAYGIAPGAAGEPSVRLGQFFAYPSGFSTLLWGTHTIENFTSVVANAGAGNNFVSGTATIKLATRWLYPGSITPLVFGTALIAGQIRYITPTGIASFASGTTRIEFLLREIQPATIFSMVFGTPRASLQQWVYPSGWQSESLGDFQSWVNVQPLPVSGFKNDAYGQPDVQLYKRYVQLMAGINEFGMGTQFVQNQDRYITGVTLNPDPNQPLTEWGNRLFWYVENRNRVIGGQGWPSSRFGYTVVQPGLTIELATLGDQTVWGSNMISHKIRSYVIGGYDFSYVSTGGIVYNAARVLYPSGFSSYGVGTPVEVINANRNLPVQQFQTDEYGTPFVAFAIRYLTQTETAYPNIPLPEVRHDPYPISPTGWDSFTTGGHEVVEFFNIAAPHSFNVHTPEWVSEPVVLNRNIEVTPWSSDYSDYGLARVYNKIQYLLPVGTDMSAFGAHMIADTRRTVYPVGIGAGSVNYYHRIVNDMLLPYTQTTIPSSIAPAFAGTPIVYSTTIVVEGIKADGYGSATVRQNVIDLVGQGIGIPTEDKMGTPEMVYPRRLYPAPIYTYNDSPVSGPGSPPGGKWVPDPTVFPVYVHAPAPEFPVDYNLTSWGGFGWPWFGHSYIDHKHRRVYVNNASGVTNFMDGEVFGDPEVANRNRRVYPVPIYRNVVSIPVIPFTDQFLTLDEFNFGIEIPEDQVGSPVIDFAPLVNRPVYPTGWNSQAIGSQRVELFNRQIYPAGIEHKAAYWFGADPWTWPYPMGMGPLYQLFDPWGQLYIGPPRRLYPQGFDSFTLGAGTFIAFRIRYLYPSWDEGDGFAIPGEDFSPMRVRFARNTYVFSGFSTFEAGTPTVSSAVRDTVPFGIFPGATGVPNVLSVIQPAGIDSAEYGDIDRWEADKVKAHGDDMLQPGYPRIDRRIFPAGFGGVIGDHSLGRGVYPSGIAELAIYPPVVTTEFYCGLKLQPVVPYTIDSGSVGTPTVT